VEVILSSTSKKLITKNKRVLKQQAKNVSAFTLGKKSKPTKGEKINEHEIGEESDYEGDETINSQNKRVRKNRDQISLLQDAYEANGGHLDGKQQQQLSVSLGLSRQQIYKWCWDQKKKRELELSEKKNVCPDEFGGYSKAWLKGKEEEDEESAVEDITKIIGFDVTQKAVQLICETSPKTAKRFLAVEAKLPSPLPSPLVSQSPLSNFTLMASPSILNTNCFRRESLQQPVASGPTPPVDINREKLAAHHHNLSILQALVSPCQTPQIFQQITFSSYPKQKLELKGSTILQLNQFIAPSPFGGRLFD